MLSTIIYRAGPRRSASTPGRRPPASRISARHELLSCSPRTEAVRELEAAIRHLESDPKLTNPCEVALFEIDGDESLHCNVTHRYVTRPVVGWAGPGQVAEGFVYNRRFRDTRNVLRHIREMVCAPRV
jgi:hypothetical protein